MILGNSSLDLTYPRATGPCRILEAIIAVEAVVLHEVEVIQAEAVEVVLEAGALALVDEVDSSLAGADEAAPVTVAVDEEEASRIAVAEEVATVEVVEVSIEDAVEEGLAVGAADLVVNLRGIHLTLLQK